MSEFGESDIFHLNGTVRSECLEPAVEQALKDSISHARSTRWDSVRTPHLFMGLLSVPDGLVYLWAKKLGTETHKLLEQFRELFTQDAAPVPPLQLNREFLSDNVIRLIRQAHLRTIDQGRDQISALDLLITIFAVPGSIVAECFERIGVSAAQLIDHAMSVEAETSLS